MTLTLVDWSITYPYGLLEYFLVRVDDLLFLADLVIVGMEEDYETPLLLGRPLLATSKALIDVEMGELILRFNKQQIIFNVFGAMNHQKENPQCYIVDVVEEMVQKVFESGSLVSSMDRIIMNHIDAIE